MGDSLSHLDDLLESALCSLGWCTMADHEHRAKKISLKGKLKVKHQKKIINHLVPG